MVSSPPLLTAIGAVFLQSILLMLRFWFIPVLVPKQVFTNRKLRMAQEGKNAEPEDASAQESETAEAKEADLYLKAHLTHLINAAESLAPTTTDTPPTRLFRARQKVFSGLASTKKVVTTKYPNLPAKDEMPEYFLTKRNSLKTIVGSVKPKTSSKVSRAVYYSVVIGSQALHLYSFLAALALVFDFVLSLALGVPNVVTGRQALVAALAARDYAMSSAAAPPAPPADDDGDAASVATVVHGDILDGVDFDEVKDEDSDANNNKGEEDDAAPRPPSSAAAEQVEPVAVTASIRSSASVASPTSKATAGAGAAVVGGGANKRKNARKNNQKSKKQTTTAN